MDIINDITGIIYTEEDIKNMVGRLAAEISRDYQGREPLLVGVLKGSFVFMADLMRMMDIHCAVEFMVVSSYGSGVKTSGTVKIIKDLDINIEDRDIILIEDILDSGLTLSYIKGILLSRNPKSISICTLLNKPERRQVDIQAEYVGSDVPDVFIVGYGLDYNERYRNAPYIAALKPEVYQK